MKWDDGEDGNERIVQVGKDGLSCLDTNNFSCFELFKSHSTCMYRNFYEVSETNVKTSVVILGLYLPLFCKSSSMITAP